MSLIVKSSPGWANMTSTTIVVSTIYYYSHFAIRLSLYTMKSTSLSSWHGIESETKKKIDMTFLSNRLSEVVLYYHLSPENDHAVKKNRKNLAIY